MQGVPPAGQQDVKHTAGCRNSVRCILLKHMRTKSVSACVIQCAWAGREPLLLATATTCCPGAQVGNHVAFASLLRACCAWRARPCQSPPIRAASECSAMAMAGGRTHLGFGCTAERVPRVICHDHERFVVAMAVRQAVKSLVALKVDRRHAAAVVIYAAKVASRRQGGGGCGGHRRLNPKVRNACLTCRYSAAHPTNQSLAQRPALCMTKPAASPSCSRRAWALWAHR